MRAAVASAVPHPRIFSIGRRRRRVRCCAHSSTRPGAPGPWLVPPFVHAVFAHAIRAGSSVRLNTSVKHEPDSSHRGVHDARPRALSLHDSPGVLAERRALRLTSGRTRSSHARACRSARSETGACLIDGATFQASGIWRNHHALRFARFTTAACRGSSHTLQRHARARRPFTHMDSRSRRHLCGA